VKPFIETLRVTNPVRQSRASSREASLAWGRVTATAKRRAGERALPDPVEGGAALWTRRRNHAEDTVPHQRVTVSRWIV
jgi:hypothetical protein